MKYIKQIIPASIVSFALMFTASTTSGDIGSKHREQSKYREQDKKSTAKRVRSRPFNFDKIVGTVDFLHIGEIENTLGGNILQADLEALPPGDAFIEAFEAGDELFEIKYNALDGVGINVGNGKRFTSIPRLDLDGPRAWASVFPHRITGPNGDSCLSCHNDPVADGAGGVNDNTIRIDPERKQEGFIERQAPHIFGMGGVQLLAEEMTVELQALRDAAIVQSCSSHKRIDVELEAKGINFGAISVSCKRIRFRNLEGVDRDLVVKPFEWKGLTAFVRDFVRGASHQELGMQAIELVGDADSDFDGVTEELTVGDITALAIYTAGQQRPVTKLELNEVVSELTDEELEVFGLPLSDDEIASIENGEIVFDELECGSCHTPSITVNNPIYSEPSRNPDFRDSVFPIGEEVGLPEVAIEFDLTSDIFVNEITLPSTGQTLGEFERDENGGAIIRLYGDLKRHDMGNAMAEDIDEGNVGASVFMTENLWGVGSTAPYLHDGRATTLAEAILFHGGDAKKSRRLFKASSDSDKADLIAFLDSLVLFLEGE